MHINERIRLMRRAGAVRRYHTETVIKEETVAEHTFNVLNLVMALTQGHASRELILAALFHDMGEHKVGDLPAPTKRGLPAESRHTINEMEREAVKRIHGGIPELTPMEEKVLHIADRLDGLWKCIDEVRMGNRHIWAVGENCVKYLAELDDGTSTFSTAIGAAISLWNIEVNST